jgi:hypothetical protein
MESTMNELAVIEWMALICPVTSAMKKQHMLISAISSCLVFLALHCQAVEPDALTRAEAVEKATSQAKMILLIVSDTNNCTGCITLEFGTLPSTNNPPMRQFLGESFIYWACGPEQNCTEFRTYTGPGTVPLPTFYIIDPRNPQTYAYHGSGDSDPLIFVSNHVFFAYWTIEYFLAG